MGEIVDLILEAKYVLTMSRGKNLIIDGAVAVNGDRIIDVGKRDEIRKRFGMVFQAGALFDSLTVGQNVGFPLSRHSDMSKEEIARTVSEKLQMVALEHIQDLMPVDLSGGMRKRVSLARAISMEPEAILYDEPTTGLDPVTAEGINRLISELHDKLKVTSVVVTHDMHSAFSVATRMAMLHNGRIIAEGTKEEFRRVTDPVVVGFLNPGQHYDSRAVR